MPPFPKWVEQLSGDDLLLAKTKFRISYCALMYHPSGGLSNLSVALGKSRALIYNSIPKWRHIPAHYCVAIEQLIGRDVVTREWLNPDIFTIEG